MSLLFFLKTYQNPPIQGNRITLIFFQMGLLFSIFSCSKPQSSITQNVTQSIRYLALGDSYTIGEGVLEAERYPNQLAELLRKAGVKVDKLKIIAKTGWRTDQLQQAIEQDKELEDFNLVSLLIGVNNQYQGKNIEIYRKEFEELLQKAIQLAQSDKNRVFVLSIPDYGVTPFGKKNEEKIARELDEYNRINQEISLKYGVAYFDITPISRQAKTQPDLIASDQLHPSGKMYQKWIELIFSDLLKKIRV